ncbi:MAG: sigma-54 dependent transcriptional regulator [Acidobacteriia bacterium]|nr:sigma-54 dependent transcriptional regulator [Terriglobia bacterium]
MGLPATILVVDDEPSVLRYMRTLLEVEDYKVETAASGREALERVERDPPPDLVLLDLLMPELDGLGTLVQLRRIRPGIKVIMLSCVSDPRKVVEAGRHGATDYLTKPFQKSQLDLLLKQYLDPQAVAELGLGHEEAEDLGNDLYFVAASPEMRRIRAQVAQIARVEVPVLLLGESGTGKEVVARLIHKLSSRANRTFLKVNCAALPAELLESELFGYEAGAFTGAMRPKPGKFELCDKGTILLDEIGEMPVSMQAKLLHVLQDQQFSRLGSRSVVRVDVRILAATNVDVQQAMATGKLRQDLYYRLNAVSLLLPPLRERREEIPVMLRHFMARFAARYARTALPLSPRLFEACLRHPWPGNLRELENFVKRFLILGDESLALAELETRDEFGAAPAGFKPEPAPDRPGGLKSLVRSLKDGAEMQAIRRALDETNWNRKKAAALLNISYKALLYKIRQYGLGE